MTATTRLGAATEAASRVLHAAADGPLADRTELAGLEDALHWCARLDHRADEPAALLPAVILAALAEEAGQASRSDPNQIGSELRGAGVPAAVAQLIGRLSCLDCNTERPLLDADPDGAVVMDARLAVLARPPDAYRSYLRAVSRRDTSGRRWAQVRGLLDRDAVYATPECRVSLEGRARYNLAFESSELREASQV
ncbi:MAG: hypothetical protein GEV09_14445 [Pseudonocardiaceae bacterium]|nr:hypothetical protein [Pseudonocardiaceae bacterium]